MSPSPSHKSTGPSTPTGKAASSQNALRHGLAAGRLLIPGEDPAEWQTLLADLTGEWEPTTATERILVEDMARHHWLLERAIRLQSEALAAAQPGEIPQTFAVLLRYQTTNERAFSRALHSLEALHKTRRDFVSQENKQAVAKAQAAVWASLSAPFPKSSFEDYLEKKRAASPAPTAAAPVAVPIAAK